MYEVARFTAPVIGVIFIMVAESLDNFSPFHPLILGMNFVGGLAVFFPVFHR